jgi:hypothetical protein
MSDEEPTQGSELLMTTWSDGEAAMVRQILASHGIPSQGVSHVPHSVLPFTMDGLGEIRILVPASRLREARELLAEHRRQGLEIIDGGEPPSDDATEEEDDQAPGDVESTER